MTILVTNDDGDSLGLRILLDAAAKLDKQAYAIIPNRQRSAIGCALTLHKPLRLHKIPDNKQTLYSLNGTPSDCVIFGANLASKEIPRPDLVLSGINWGDNAGISCILGSGTVGACWQAVQEGIPAIAFSRYRQSRDWKTQSDYTDVELISKKVEEVLQILKPKLSKNSFFNVNFPSSLETAKIVLGKKLQFRRYKTEIVKRKDPDDRTYYWTKGHHVEPDKGTDIFEVKVNLNIHISEISLSIFDSG